MRTTGQAQSPAGLFGVTVEALSGAFLKTHVVTVWPRFLVRNNLKRKVGVVPTLEVPRKDNHDWQQLGTRPTEVIVYLAVGDVNCWVSGTYRTTTL